MKNIFKQFEELGTHSNQSEYTRAVVKLTLTYTVGVFIVLAMFNFLVYGLFSNNIENRESERIEQSLFPEDNYELVEERIEEIEASLLNILLISDCFILVLTFCGAYILSKRTLAPLEENYQKQIQFSADVAHELRTPLAVMQAGSEVILRSDRGVSEYKRFIQESLDEVKRLTTLSNNLLFLAYRNRKKSILMTKVSLTEICRKQVDVMRVYATTKNITINTVLTSEFEVLGIKDDLTRLVMNLLKNAIDYNKPNGMVTVTLNKIKNQVILSVEDTGLGINNKDLPHIFERFYKADSSRQKNSSGTGLGLAIIKGIVDEHHGAIKVKSVFGIGSTFEVILPSA